MRHGKAGRKFGRNTSHRRAMFRNLAGNLVLHERIETTDTKAKELRRIVDRLITKATRLGDALTVDLAKLSDEERERVVARRTHARRIVAQFLPQKVTRTAPGGELEDVELVDKLFTEIAPRYMSRVKDNKGGGYTRILKLGERRGDNAPMAIIELLPGDGKAGDEKKSKKADKAEGETKAAKGKAKAESAEKPKKAARAKKKGDEATE